MAPSQGVRAQDFARADSSEPRGEQWWESSAKDRLINSLKKERPAIDLHKEMINRKSEDGFTALSLCAQGGHSEAVEYLLSQAAAILGRVATIRSPRRLPC